MNQYYLLLGSNVGNSPEILRQTLKKIAKELGIIKAQSSMYETQPWGKTDQANFINMAIELESLLLPEQLFEQLKRFEVEAGRTPTEKWGPRALDIDILYAGDHTIESANLTIPHQGIYDRNFVLIPLMEIAGEYEDPVKKITIDDIYDQCKDTSEVFLFETND
jgi:2-amino-4-hydroxy-6-hydroxymethyldihydropteridine diphosphokinase